MSVKICVMFLLNMLIKRKMNLFIKMNKKVILNFFSYNKLKFQPRT